MATNTLNIAESWESVYDAFDNVNFATYDFDSVKSSLLNYLKIYYPENFNDYNGNDLMVAIIETFAYAVEMIAYRVDMASHENFMPDAQRKKNILAMAKYISYNATRNIPLRGLVKLDSISTTEELYDSRGENLTNKIIKWNDANNPNWKEQFLTVFNKIVTTRFGQPLKTKQVDNTVYQIYTLNNTLQKSYNVFKNGVYSYYAQNGNENLQMELVSSDIDDYGVFEKEPDLNTQFNIVYANDGLGDSSQGTGFMMFTKQGAIKRYTFTFNNPIPNTFIDINAENINDLDVYVQSLDYYDGVTTTWEKVETVSGQNVFFNNIENRKKYEVETREDDKIRIIFGDGDFSDMPTGNLAVWVRTSENRSVQMPKNKIVQMPIQVGYESTTGQIEHFTFTYSLTASLQNNSESESIERVRFAASKIFYTQNRMVNGEDYNTYLFKDPSVLKLKAFNRTYVGQSRYLTPTDASGKYQSIKIFGDDMRIYYDFSKSTQSVTTSQKLLIDNVIEPLLATKEVQTLVQFINHMNSATRGLRIEPRTKLYETKWYKLSGNSDETEYVSVQEKTPIQKFIDTHWYGFYDGALLKTDTGTYALVDSDADGKIYDSDYRLAKTDDSGVIHYYDYTSGVQPGAREKKFALKYTPGVAFKGSLDIVVNAAPQYDWIIECVAVQDGNQTWHVKCSNDSDTYAIATQSYIGTTYEKNDLSFTFTNYSSSKPCFNGDAFIIRAGTTKAVKLNVQGSFSLTTAVPSDLSVDYFTFSDISSAPSVDDNSWIVVIERVDDSDGNTLYWQITHRESRMICESPTTKFWFSDSDSIIDTTTQTVLRDSVSILKSNLSADKTAPLGTNREFYVNGIEKNDSGEDILTSISVLPKYSNADYFTADNANEFAELIDVDNSYVYFTVSDGVYTPIDYSSTVAALFTDSEQMIYTPTAAESDQTVYARRYGREALDFMWMHYSPSTNVVDASTTNINDIYVLTQGYYSSIISYIRGLTTVQPSKPTTLELKNSYSTLLENKMMSDTVVLHSADIKLLFGDKANKQLRSKFKVIRNSKGTLSDETVKREIVSAINSYFTIENWNFGDTFYAQDMLSKIQTTLSTEVNSIVLVPTFANNYFGNMLIVECNSHEILQSCATVDDIEIVSTYSDSTLRIK